MFHRISIRSKLVVLLALSAAIALIISSAITLYSTTVKQKEESLRVLRQLAAVTSENMRAALAFHDDDSAFRILLPLKSNPHILMATVEDEKADIFTSYSAPQLSKKDIDFYRNLIAEEIQAETIISEKATLQYMYVVTPVIFENKLIGRIAIVSDNSELREKITRHFAFLLIVSIITLGMIIIISIRLQRMFTEPIFKLINTMHEVSKTKDYKMCVISGRNDEFHDLCLGFNSMLNEIRDRDDKLSRLATTDALTGLFNRRYAMDTMKEMAVRAERKQERIGVIMMDVDFFKKINDTLGHPVGDIVLKEIGQLLLKCAREYDIVARIGGEEFLVLCDNSDEKTTAAIAERIRKSVEDHIFTYGSGSTLKATVSIGAYSVLPETHDIEKMIRVADEALYRAKSSGRNRVEMEITA